MDEEKISNQELIKSLKKEESPKAKKIIPTQILLTLILLIITLLVANYVYRQFGYYTISKQTIHWHAHLVVEESAQFIPIPPSVGLLGDVAHPSNLHTHSDDGIIHMEIKGPVRARQVMLREFFKVWQYEIDWKRAVLYVNGVRNDDLGRLIMRDGDEIEILLSSNY